MQDDDGHSEHHHENHQFHEILKRLDTLARAQHDLVLFLRQDAEDRKQEAIQMSDQFNRINASLATFNDTLVANTTAVDAVVAAGGVTPGTGAVSEADLSTVADKIDANNVTVAANTAKLTGIPAPVPVV